MNDLPTDEAIWTVACQASFVSPPRQWSFGSNIICFGKDFYRINEATVYELALLDIHAQYWEATSPQYLRRYHRVLQYNVEHCFQSNNTLQLQHTPPFLFPWLSRTIFRKQHNEKGREMMSCILKDVSEVQRTKLENGNFGADEWKLVITRFHREELTKMIKAICTERQISRHGNTQYSWRLPIFDTVQWDDIETLPTLGQACTPAICLLYKQEAIGHPWEDVLASSSLHTWAIGGIPFKAPEAKRLLDGLWLSDDIIDAYLVLCSFSWPDIKFLSTHWFSCLETWEKEASNRTISWVNVSFHASDSLLMRNIPKISKQASDVYAAMKMFTAVITVINYPKNHWITLRFNPKNQILEVFDSLAPQDFSRQKKKFEQDILLRLGLQNWKVQPGKNIPQQKGSADCGVYACQFVKHCALDLPFFQTLDENQSRLVRRMMVVELADGRIRTPWT